jgi:hypothetical protein
LIDAFLTQGRGEAEPLAASHESLLQLMAPALA